MTLIHEDKIRELKAIIAAEVVREIGERLPDLKAAEFSEKKLAEIDKANRAATAKVDQLRATFSPVEMEAHRLIRGMLWATYSRVETSNSSEEEDGIANFSATLLVDHLRQLGIGFTRTVPAK